MTNPTLVPFKAEHWMHFVHLGSTYQDEFKDALIKEHGGPAYTAICEDQILGCAGIIVHWSGMGYAWSILSTLSHGYPIWMTRTIKNCLRDIKRSLNLHRVEIVVQLEHLRWAEFVGFTLEKDGKAQKYLPNKNDVYRLEMVDK